MKIEIDYNEAVTLISLCSVMTDNMKHNTPKGKCSLSNQIVLDLESIEKKCKESLRRLRKCVSADTAVEE